MHGKQDNKDIAKQQNRYCPKCCSDNVVIMKRTGWAVVLMIILFALPVPWLKKKYYCFDCGLEWEREKNKTSP